MPLLRTDDETEPWVMPIDVILLSAKAAHVKRAGACGKIVRPAGKICRRRADGAWAVSLHAVESGRSTHCPVVNDHEKISSIVAAPARTYVCFSVIEYFVLAVRFGAL